jgi:hypothetical protein
MDTPTVSIVATSTVAVAAIISTYFQHRANMKHQRSLSDLDDLRGVLDDGAVALHQCAYSLDDLRSQMTQHRPVSFFHSEDGADLYRRIEGEGKALDALLERMSVRLGRGHEVAKAFSAADGAFLKIYRAAGLLRLEDPGDGSQSSRDQVRQFERKQAETIEISRERFDKAREWFIAASQRLAGATFD